MVTTSQTISKCKQQCNMSKTANISLPAWQKTQIHVIWQPTSILMFRGVTKLGLRDRLKPRKRRRNRLKLLRESVFMQCCFGHHAVVIEGYLFVVFCIVDIYNCPNHFYLPEYATAGWPRYTSVFATWATLGEVTVLPRLSSWVL